MKASECYGALMDAITYTIHYAPKYPLEDETDLDRDHAGIIGRLSRLETLIRSPYKRKQLAFAKREIEAAFDDYRSGRDGAEHLEEALDYINKSKSSGPPKTDFVVGQDGSVTPTDQ